MKSQRKVPFFFSLSHEALEPRRLLAIIPAGCAVLEACDYGDAPLPYPTIRADDGARHVATGPRLGATRDEEGDGQPSTAGDGEDEDGVTFDSIRVGQIDAECHREGAERAKQC